MWRFNEQILLMSYYVIYVILGAYNRVLINVIGFILIKLSSFLIENFIIY